jgi:glycosyltransferase involved in cell wall biosynthesis
MQSKPNRPKLLFFVTEDWYFCSHRLPLALAARNAGYEVAVATRVNAHAEMITREGIRLIPLRLSRGGKNPLREWRTLWALFRVLRNEKPDILHNVAVKPVLYGTLAARLAGTHRVVNALAGLGHLFAVRERAGLLRGVVKLAFRLLLRGYGQVIVQNPDDLQLLESSGAILEGQATLIRGSGVDLTKFMPSPEPEGIPMIVFAARLLWDKGVKEFVEAATILKNEGIKGRFVIVGAPDAENHAAIPKDQLEAWASEGAIECWGQRADMSEILAASVLFCLPSYYGEGVPKVLLEAAASGRPLITTDMPGCREVVEDGVNGLLVQPRDAEGLSRAIRDLLNDKERRTQMGAASRHLAEASFGIDAVTTQTLSVYNALLS